MSKQEMMVEFIKAMLIGNAVTVSSNQLFYVQLADELADKVVKLANKYNVT